MMHWPRDGGAVFASHFETWDGAHYLYLSEEGYGPGVRSNAFYPLYPGPRRTTPPQKLPLNVSALGVSLDSDTGRLLSSWVACASWLGALAALGGVALFAWLFDGHARTLPTPARSLGGQPDLADQQERVDERRIQFCHAISLTTPRD
jgi:hypothetical protein